MIDSDRPMDGEDPKDRNFVTALARGLEVLRAFRANETELSNTDIARRTGLPKATVSRLTYTLCQLEYLVADPRSGAYRLGPGVLQLGFGVLSGMEIGARAGPVLEDLTRGPNSYITAALGERFRDQVIYVAVGQSSEDVALSMHVGSRLPLFASAIGRAILVGLAPADRAALMAALDRAEPDGAAARARQLDQARAEYESRGFCTGYGDWRADVNGIAVPVRSVNNDRVYGLNVGGPSFHVGAQELEEIYAPRLIEAGRALSLHR